MEILVNGVADLNCMALCNHNRKQNVNIYVILKGAKRPEESHEILPPAFAGVRITKLVTPLPLPTIFRIRNSSKALPPP